MRDILNRLTEKWLGPQFDIDASAATGFKSEFMRELSSFKTATDTALVKFYNGFVAKIENPRVKKLFCIMIEDTQDFIPKAVRAENKTLSNILHVQDTRPAGLDADMRAYIAKHANAKAKAKLDA